jgi:hypothetical protein
LVVLVVIVCGVLSVSLFAALSGGRSQSVRKKTKAAPRGAHGATSRTAALLVGPSLDLPSLGTGLDRSTYSSFVPVLCDAKTATDSDGYKI